MSLRFRDLWGGGRLPAPPVGSKLAQTPAGARVKLVVTTQKFQTTNPNDKKSVDST